MSKTAPSQGLDDEAELDRRLAAAKGRASRRMERLRRILDGDSGIPVVAVKRALLALYSEGDALLPLDDDTPEPVPTPPAGSPFSDDPGTVVDDPAPPAPRPPAAAAAHALTAQEVLGKEALALALLAKHPEWTNRQIAEGVGCHRRTLYKWKTFLRARAVLKSGRERFPRGTRHEGRVEANSDLEE